MPVIELKVRTDASGIDAYAVAVRKGAAATDQLADSTTKAESSLGSLAKKALAVGAAYVTVASGIEQVSKATKLFVGFDDALRVASSYAGILDETSQEFGAMATAAKEAGATTSASTTTAAQALGELTSRGLSAQQAISALTPTIRLAEAAQADLGKAAAVSSGIMAGLGKDVSYLSRINDIIVGISGASSLDLEKVGESAKNAIPAANAAGESLESMMSVVGLLVDKQFKAGAAGNAYENMLISLQSPTSKATSELARMGVSTEDSKGKFIGLLPVLDQFKAKNLDLSQAVAIFGREWAGAALAATSGISEIRKDTSYLEKDIDGIAQTASKFQQGGLGGAFRELESAVEAVYIAVGEQLAPIIKAAAEYLTDYAGEAQKSAEASTLIVSGVEVAAVSLLALKGAAQTTAIAFSYLYEGYVRTAEALREPFDTGDALSNIALEIEAKGKFEKNIEDIKASREAMSQSLQGTFGETDKLIGKFDEWKKSILDTAAAKQAAAEADKVMQASAEAAGIAAGKAAAAQGKSFAEAAAAAESGKKSYLEQAKAAEQKQAADAKSTASAATAKAALEEQAAAIKQQALSYGYTAEQAQAAADKVLATGQAAAGISSAGVDGLNASLDKTAAKAQAADAALSGIGGGAAPEAPAGGIVSFTADLDLSPYRQKADELKEDIDKFKAGYHTFQLKFDGPPEFDEARKQLGELESAYSNAQAEFEKQQGFDALNQKLRETRSELSKTRSEFAGGKLVIDADPAATSALQEQERMLVNSKIAAGALGSEIQVVNGVITNIYNPTQQAKDAFEGMTDASGRIITEWRQIDGVWQEVLPNGKLLIEEINGRMQEGAAAAAQFGGAVAEVAVQASGAAGEAEKIIAELTSGVENAASKAGSLKFDQLAASTAALDIVRLQIKALDKEIETFGVTSEKGQAALAKMITMKEVEAGAQDKIKKLHDEIYETGKEAEKTSEAISSIPVAAELAASSTESLSESNKKLAESYSELQDANESFAGSFSFKLDESISGLDARISSLKETIKSLESIESYGVDTSALQEEAVFLQRKKFSAAMQKEIDNFFSGLRIPSYSARGSVSVAAGDTGTGMETPVAQAAPTYNFFGYDRSDAADIVSRANRSARRA